MSARLWPLLTIATGLGWSLAGCEPSCKNTCEKLLSCEGVDQPRVAQEDCEASCDNQATLYEEDWENQQLANELAAAKECIIDSECADIAAGDCYNPDLYVW